MKYCIAGTGGCGREALWLLQDVLALPTEALSSWVVFLDDQPKSDTVMGIPVISRKQFDPAEFEVVVAIGLPHVRRKFVESLPFETQYATLIHPSALVSPWAQIGEGAIVTARCVVSTHVKLGRFAHLNFGTTLSHDCVCGDYFTTAPQVSVSGNCTFGNDVYFGNNSCIKQGLQVCDGALIGMGAVVVKSIEEPGTYVGIPATKITKSKL